MSSRLPVRSLAEQGEEKGRIFMQKPAQQQISVRRGMPLIVELLAAGEFAAGINLNFKDIEVLKRAGAPVEWVTPSDQPILTNSLVISVAKNGPHPNAAKLYVDFILSKEGQQLVGKLNNLPVRADVPSDFPPRLTHGADGKPLRFFPYDLAFINKVNLMQKEFNQLFMQPGGK